MYAEQALRTCARCRAAFAVQYEFEDAGDGVPDHERSTVRIVECPRCRHLNPLLLPRFAKSLIVKALVAA